MLPPPAELPTAEAGLRSGVRLYDLRHGWATAALRAGLHPKLVQEVMRHASYSTTADTYSHVMPTQSAEAVAAVAALLEIPSEIPGHDGSGTA